MRPLRRLYFDYLCLSIFGQTPCHSCLIFLGNGHSAWFLSFMRRTRQIWRTCALFVCKTSEELFISVRSMNNIPSRESCRLCTIVFGQTSFVFLQVGEAFIRTRATWKKNEREFTWSIEFSQLRRVANRSSNNYTGIWIILIRLRSSFRFPIAFSIFSCDNGKIREYLKSNMCTMLHTTI